MNSRSPGCTWRRPATGVPSWTWLVVPAGIATPAAAQAAWTSPEQS